MSNDTPKNPLLVSINKPRGVPVHLRRVKSIYLGEDGSLAVTCKSQQHRIFWLNFSPEGIKMLYEAYEALKNASKDTPWRPDLKKTS